MMLERPGREAGSAFLSAPTPPKAMLLAELLMYLAGGVAMLSVLVSMIGGELGDLPLISLVTAGLWFWMAQANRRGRGWARIAGSVLFVTCTFATAFTLLAQLAYFYVGNTPILAGRTVSQWLISVAVTGLLWSRDCSRYYRSMEEMAGPRLLRAPGAARRNRMVTSVPEVPAVVTDEEVSALRACMHGDVLTGHVNGELLEAALTEAVACRFGRRAAKREVTSYVAEVLRRRAGTGEAVSPQEAGKLLSAALRNQAAEGIAPVLRRTICSIFVSAIVSDERLGDDEVNALLTAARKRADYKLYLASQRSFTRSRSKFGPVLNRCCHLRPIGLNRSGRIPAEQ